jgi:hypothetical protein
LFLFERITQPVTRQPVGHESCISELNDIHVTNAHITNVRFPVGLSAGVRLIEETAIKETISNLRNKRNFRLNESALCYFHAHGADP